jgi:hypothetical protein
LNPVADIWRTLNIYGKGLFLCTQVTLSLSYILAAN